MFKRTRFTVAVTLFVFSSLFLPAFGKRITREQALVAGESFKNLIIQKAGGWGPSPTAEISGCVEFESGGKSLGYLLPVSPRGYIVLNLLDQMDPVKAYSTESDLDPSQPGGFARMLKDVMRATIDRLEREHGPVESIPDDVPLGPKKNKQSWDSLLGNAGALEHAEGEVVSMLTVGPLLTTSWHQGAPFNNLCPIGYNGNKTVVGCAATAAAQIMKFWNYPLSGFGSRTYDWDGDDSCSGSTAGGNLSANFAQTYAWASMFDDDDYGYTGTQADAVAQLCYNVGVAFYMDYGACGSGAFVNYAPPLFEDIFNYAPTTLWKDRTTYATAADWFAQVKAEFDSPLPRPTFYGIPNHGIVCDGYQQLPSSYFVHMNYGWDTSHNAWYAVDNLYHPAPGPASDEYMLTGIQPKNRLYIGYVGPDGTVRRAYWNENATYFTAYAQPGGGRSSHAPALAVFRNRQFIAVKGGTDNNIYLKSRSGMETFGESAWTAIPGPTVTSPAMVTYNNRLYLFATNASGSVSYKSMGLESGWSSWTTVSGSQTSWRPGLVVFNDRLYYFETDSSDLGIWYRAMDDSGAWSSWLKIPTGSSNAGPTPVVYNGMLSVFVKGLAGSLLWFSGTSNPDAPATWTAWASLAGSSASSPSVCVVPETNVLHLAVRGNMVPKLWHRFFDPSVASWSPWQSMDALDADAQSIDTPVLSTHYWFADQMTAPGPQ